MAWASPIKGFNFRLTGTYVTDLTNEVGLSSTTPTNLGNYPKTYNFVGQSDTVTGGWISVSNIGSNDRNTTPTEGIEFAGSQRTVNNGGTNPQQLEIDLADSNGTYQISVAFGSCSSTEISYYSILDGTTVIAGPFGPITTNANQYAGSDGNIVSSPANYAAWVAATNNLVHTFLDSGGPSGVSRLFINIGDPAHAGSGNTTIAHVRIVQGAPSGGALLMGQICT